MPDDIMTRLGCKFKSFFYPFYFYSGHIRAYKNEKMGHIL